LVKDMQTTLAKENLTELERQVDEKRRALSASMAQVRLQLQPDHLANEAAERLKLATSDVLHRTAEKASTPTGVGVTAAGVALSALAAGWSMRRRTRTGISDKQPADLLDKHPAVPDNMPSEIDRSPEATSNGSLGLFKPAANLVMALAVGAALAKLVPVTVSEEKYLNGVGEELRRGLEQWSQRQVTQLVQPPAGESFRPINAIALGVGLLLAAGRSRVGKDDGK
jgi:MYXO-CTERM domain-containing protein